jgi:hypothetical protein
MTEVAVKHRRAIEALRAGVPNRDAVSVLGCSQPHIEEKFQSQLTECQALAADGKQVPGLLVMGGFGAGKSHLLEHLHHLAREQGFVSSKIVISKETPLYDPAKLYRASIDAAVMPTEEVGSALREIALTLDKAPGYPMFYQRVTSDTSEFDARFAASLVVYENAKAKDIDLCDRVISFWSGHKLNVTEFKKALKQCGEAVTYRIGKIAPRDLAWQRFRFATQLMLAAGYPGWVLLFDEVELISRYSWLQRARSYAEFARRMGALKGESVPGMVTVFASTDDLGLVLEGDEDQVPAKLAVKDSDGDSLLSSQAQCGMRKLREAVALTPPDRARIEEAGEKLRQVHAQAYDWSPSPARFAGEVLAITRMRTYVRSWINQWDLERLYPGYKTEIEAKEIQPTRGEDPDLEHTSEPDGDAE